MGIGSAPKSEKSQLNGDFSNLGDGMDINRSERLYFQKFRSQREGFHTGENSYMLV